MGSWIHPFNVNYPFEGGEDVFNVGIGLRNILYIIFFYHTEFYFKGD